MDTRYPFRLPRLLLLLSCLPLIVGGLAAWELHSTQRTASEVMAINARSMRAAEELAIGIRDIQAELNRFLTTGDATAFEKINLMRRVTDYWLAEARRTAITVWEDRLIERLTRGYEHFFGKLGRVERQPHRGQQRTAQREGGHRVARQIAP